jgi:hypothetical protein
VPAAEQQGQYRADGHYCVHDVCLVAGMSWMNSTLDLMIVALLRLLVGDAAFAACSTVCLERMMCFTLVS